eukprot:3524897-Alexandrium_andersonii.AAC.1
MALLGPRFSFDVHSLPEGRGSTASRPYISKFRAIPRCAPAGKRARRWRVLPGAGRVRALGRGPLGHRRVGVGLLVAIVARRIRRGCLRAEASVAQRMLPQFGARAASGSCDSAAFPTARSPRCAGCAAGRRTVDGATSPAAAVATLLVAPPV